MCGSALVCGARNEILRGLCHVQRLVPKRCGNARRCILSRRVNGYRVCGVVQGTYKRGQVLIAEAQRILHALIPNVLLFVEPVSVPLPLPVVHVGKCICARVGVGKDLVLCVNARVGKCRRVRVRLPVILRVHLIGVLSIAHHRLQGIGGRGVVARDCRILTAEKPRVRLIPVHGVAELLIRQACILSNDRLIIGKTTLRHLIIAVDSVTSIIVFTLRNSNVGGSSIHSVAVLLIRVVGVCGNGVALCRIALPAKIGDCVSSCPIVFKLTLIELGIGVGHVSGVGDWQFGCWRHKSSSSPQSLDWQAVRSCRRRHFQPNKTAPSDWNSPNYCSFSWCTIVEIACVIGILVSVVAEQTRQVICHARLLIAESV